LAAEGRETKAAVVYQYLTGARFKQHMQAIVEAFTTMQEDLSAEKKVMMKQWAKREMQIERVIGSTAGLYGDLQGIVGGRLGDMSELTMDPRVRLAGVQSSFESSTDRDAAVASRS